MSRSNSESLLGLTESFFQSYLRTRAEQACIQYEPTVTL